MFLDAADSRDSFRCDPQRLPLFARLVLGDPADNNVLRPDLRPLLAAKFGEETGADRPVVAVARVLWRALCRPHRADDVCPAYEFLDQLPSQVRRRCRRRRYRLKRRAG